MSINIKDIDIHDMEINTKDYPDFCDSFVILATWKDCGETLTDAELDELNDDSDLIYELCMARLF